MTTDDLTALREVVDSQVALNHSMTLVPTDVLSRILATLDNAPAALSRPAPAPEALRAAADYALRVMRQQGWHENGAPAMGTAEARLRAALTTPSPEPHPPYPLPADFDAMSDAELWAYIERIGAGDRIRRAMAEPIDVHGYLMSSPVDEHDCRCEGQPWCIPHLARHVRGDEIRDCLDHDHVEPGLHVFEPAEEPQP